MSPPRAPRSGIATGADAGGLSQEWWHALFSEYYPRVYPLLCSRLGEEAAKEAAHTVFVRTGSRAPRSPDATIGEIVMRTAREILVARLAEVDPGRVHRLGFARDEYLTAATRKWLDGLPPDDRVALELRYVIGLTGHESAVLLGLEPSAFAGRLRRASRLYRATVDA